MQMMLQDMSIVTGDPVKFGLALVSIGYCVVLLIQHYVLYCERKPSHYANKARQACRASSGNEQPPVQWPAT